MYKEYYLADLITLSLSVYPVFVKTPPYVRAPFVRSFVEALASNYALIIISNRQYIKTKSIQIRRVKVFPPVSKELSDQINQRVSKLERNVSLSL